MIERGTILEMERGGLITKVKVVEDFGEFWNLKVLEHHTPSEVGTFLTVPKKELKVYEICK